MGLLSFVGIALEEQVLDGIVVYWLQTEYFTSYRLAVSCDEGGEDGEDDFFKTTRLSKNMQNDDFIIVKARISMKKTADGGRISGFTSGYRPNHVFEMPEDLSKLEAYIGDIRFEDMELFGPEETHIVTVRFIKYPPIEKYMKVGQQWFINEGARTLGFGEIVEIITS